MIVTFLTVAICCYGLQDSFIERISQNQLLKNQDYSNCDYFILEKRKIFQLFYTELRIF